MKIFNSSIFTRSVLVVTTYLFVVFAQADTPVKRVDKQSKNKVETITKHSSRQIQSVGKVAAPIDFVQPARFRGDSGQLVDIVLNIRASTDVEQLLISLNVESGLELDANLRLKQWSSISAGQIVPLQFKVLATAEGLSYVNVICETRSGKGTRMTSYSIPVEIGDIGKKSTRKAQGKLVQDEQGVMLQVMEARPVEGHPK